MGKVVCVQCETCREGGWGVSGCLGHWQSQSQHKGKGKRLGRRESGSRVGCRDAACAVLRYSCTVLHC